MAKTESNNETSTFLLFLSQRKAQGRFEVKSPKSLSYNGNKNFAF